MTQDLIEISDAPLIPGLRLRHFRGASDYAPMAAPAKFFHAFTTQYEVGLAAMLVQEGYRPVRYHWQMVRPTLEHSPDFP